MSIKEQVKYLKLVFQFLAGLFFITSFAWFQTEDGKNTSTINLNYEPFIDLNNNNVYDYEEPFIDSGNGRYDVGEKFTEEAKKIKYGEAKDRAIYGEASLEQTKELIEEDINFQQLPWTPDKKSN